MKQNSSALQFWNKTPFQWKYQTLTTSFIIVDSCEELKAFVAEKEAETGHVNLPDILQQIRQMQFQLNITPEYKLYIAMCGIFGPHRNIVKHWDKFEKVFMDLVEQDKEMGKKHLF